MPVARRATAGRCRPITAFTPWRCRLSDRAARARSIRSLAIRGVRRTPRRLEDAYRFRTPSLRNVAMSAPYGHNGSHATLESIVRHHLDPLAALDAWQPDGLPLIADPVLDAADLLTFQDVREMARYRRHVDIESSRPSDEDIDAIIAFLGTLTDEASLTGVRGAPQRVPSGLPVE